MNFSALFVRRPVLTGLLTLSILVFGLAAYRLLPVSDLPNVDFPTISVSANLPGASAETMAASVATPLEKQFSTIAGLDSMTSTSAQGNTQIVLQFALSRNIDAAAQDVQAAISAAQRQLPTEMTTPPSFSKVNPADSPIYYISLTSDTLPLAEVNEYAETMISQRLSTISGVAQVLVYGSKKHAVRVQVDPQLLAARGIGIDEVQAAIASHNVNKPTGTLYGPQRAITVEATGQLTSAAAYREMIVAWRNGAPVHLGELGRVIDGYQNDKAGAWWRNKPAVTLAVMRQPGINTVQLVESIEALLPVLREQMPPGINLEVTFDRAQSIRASVDDVKFTLVLSLALVVMVIFLFLRNATATLIPSLAMPLAVIGTFSVMYLGGFSLDNLSLMALTLSVGFVVDDAIVVLENITRHREMGKPALQATLEGSREIGFTVISMTLSMLAVFIPILFMGGVVGRLMHEFAITIMAAVTVSCVVSLTLTPLLCARLLKAPDPAARHNRIYQVSEAFLDLWKRSYVVSLDWVMAHRRFTLGIFLAVSIATAILFVVVPKGFLPNDDTGMIFGLAEGAQDISWDAMVSKQAEAARIIGENPHVAGVVSYLGAGGSSSTLNLGRLPTPLKPSSERPSPEEIIRELKPRLNSIPGLKVYLQSMPSIRLGGRFTKSLYQYTLQDADTQELFKWAPIIEEKMKAIPGLEDVNSDLQISNPKLSLEIDREKAAALGVTPAQIEDALYTAFGARQVSTIYTPTNEYWVLLEVLPEHQTDANALDRLYVRSAGGGLVPLGAMTRVGQGVSPLTVTHLGQVPSVTISFNLAPGVSLSTAIARIQKLHDSLHVPGTLNGNFQGSAQAFQSSLAGMGWLLVMSIFVIYVVLGILYESTIHPLTILSGLPTAGLGALITLMLFGREMDIYAYVGIVMLVGIVKKNAIMMIDFAIEGRKAGKTADDAIYDACMVRFRPIMMTTMAALLATVPIALGIGANGSSRQTLGLAVVGGLFASQFLTLYITPVIYLYLDRLAERMHGRQAVANVAAAE